MDLGHQHHLTSSMWQDSLSCISFRVRFQKYYIEASYRWLSCIRGSSYSSVYLFCGVILFHQSFQKFSEVLICSTFVLEANYFNLKWFTGNPLAHETMCKYVRKQKTNVNILLQYYFSSIQNLKLYFKKIFCYSSSATRKLSQ